VNSGDLANLGKKRIIFVLQICSKKLLLNHFYIFSYEMKVTLPQLEPCS
jgi:hypothetical protein